MSVVVRLWEPRDREAVVGVVQAVYVEYGFTWEADGYHADLYDVPAYYPRPRSAFWVAEQYGVVCGCVGLSVFERPVPGEPGGTTVHDGKVRVAAAECELCRLYVSPDHRRVGAGTALVQHLIQEVRARGLTRVELWSDKRLEDAHRLYHRLGAVVVGERVCDDPDLSPEWGLLLDLSGLKPLR